MSVKDMAVVITGGGIGLAAARAFAVEGAHVLITGRRAARLEEIARVEARIDWLVADVSNPADAQRTIARAIELWGRLDVLVNNAGAGAPMVLAEHGRTRQRGLWSKCGGTDAVGSGSSTSPAPLRRRLSRGSPVTAQAKPRSSI